MTSHAEFLRVEGGDRELSVAIRERRWRELTTLTARGRALCEVAERMSAQPTSMTQGDWQPLRDLGFSDEMILEVAHVVGIFNHLTRLADGLGLELDPQTEEAARSGVPLERVTPQDGAPTPAPRGVISQRPATVIGGAEPNPGALGAVRRA